MHTSLGLKLADISLKCANYWQSVLRFGLPFIVLYRGIDYLVFFVTADNTGLRYHWRLALIMDVPVMLFVSALWWGFMREVASWKRRNQDVGDIKS